MDDPFWLQDRQRAFIYASTGRFRVEDRVATVSEIRQFAVESCWSRCTNANDIGAHDFGAGIRAPRALNSEPALHSATERLPT